MIPLVSMILLFVFLVINSGILFYFIRKYQDTQLRTTLYWALAYLFFILAILDSIIVGFGDVDLKTAVEVQVPFVMLGLAALSMSAISTGIFTEKSLPIEISFGVIAAIAFILYYVGLNSITLVVFILLAVFSVIVYFYLAISGNNYRIAVISVGLLLQAVSGRLATTGTIDHLTQLIFNSIGQILIAVGLLGVGLKNRA